MGKVNLPMPATLRVGLLLLATASAVDYNLKYFGHEKDVDPEGKHCFDVQVDTSNKIAKSWWAQNEWMYVGTASYGFKNGTCDESVYPVLEHSDNGNLGPDSGEGILRRKWGHSPSVEV